MSPRASRGRAAEDVVGPAGHVADAAGWGADRPDRVAAPAEDPPGPAEPAVLELRYRRWLRVLPKAYREAREQEMVDIFLARSYGDDPENADLTAKFGGVGVGEVASVLALAWRLRWADAEGPARFRVRAAALPVATVSMLTVLAVSAAVSLCGKLWLLLIPPGDLAISPLDLAFGTAPGFWPLVQVWSFVLWIPAFVVALGGTRAANGTAALLAAVPALVGLVDVLGQPGTGVGFASDWTAVVVQWAVVGGLATMAAAAAGRTPMPWRRFAAAALVGLAGYEIITVVALLRPPAAVLIPLAVVFFGVGGATTGVWFVATVIASATLAIRAMRGARPAAATLLALAALGTAATLLLLSGMPVAWQLASQGESPWDALLVGMVIQCALTAAITVTAGVLAARRIRRLPAVTYLSAGGSSTFTRSKPE